MLTHHDAVVVGSGPNGLSAAIALARAGWSVLVLEAAPVIGGGMRSEELTLPGFVHDVCSSVHPLGIASPFFRSLPLTEHGLEWVMPPAALAHPLDDGSAAMLERTTEATGRTIGGDAGRYRALMDPFVERWAELLPELLAPLRFPRHPVLMARFGLRALRSASGLLTSQFRGEPARALLAGSSAHSMIPLTAAGSAAFGLVLALSAHVDGWPFVRGGTRALAAALASYLRSLGGEIVTGSPVRSLAELPPAKAVLLDLTARQVLEVAGDRLPGRYRAALQRYRYGPGVCKVDWALAEPIPWRAGECARAGTVHLGGTLAELVAAEEAPWRGAPAERPFVLLSQPTLFDPGRAPAGKHTAWAYCHVPNGADVDMTACIEAQVERFAPGFRDIILARTTLTPPVLERRNANLVGGDVGGGANTLDQIVFRPTFRRVPYTTPVPGLFLCSASTP
ncbi:MAG: phytoene desaturase family protein, partial [Gemmatimonadaceae bacterium]